MARLDWAKLLLSRVAVALFWFNPLVWLLAREAHQLREEAADDSVLATDIDETEYARLLVGVARHECRGLLLGAHGVAPAKNSLARRVKRVLDGAVKRAPGGWRWGSAAAFFAAGMAVPVAALNLVPATAAGSDVASNSAPAGPHAVTAAPTAVAGVATPQATAIARDVVAVANSGGGTIVTHRNGKIVLTGPSGSAIEVYPADSTGRRRTILTGPGGNIIAYADARAVPGLANVIFRSPGRHSSAIDRAIEMKAAGVTPEYIASIRSAAPQLRLNQDDLVQLKAVGVTPAFIQELARLGYRKVNADEIAGAYAVGVREDYIRSLAAAGYGKIALDELTQLKAVGVTPGDVERFRRAGFGSLDIDKLVEVKTLGITPEELRASERYEP